MKRETQVLTQTSGRIKCRKRSIVRAWLPALARPISGFGRPYMSEIIIPPFSKAELRSQVLHDNIRFFQHLIQVKCVAGNVQYTRSEHKRIKEDGFCSLISSKKIICIKKSWLYILLIHFHISLLSQNMKLLNEVIILHLWI